jgi:hypothetical protein
VKSARAALPVANLFIALRCYRFKIERGAAIEFVKKEGMVERGINHDKPAIQKREQ